ncbi:FAS-associated death domain protein [Bagarius yarrelli]|uniref:FAS-associated death domain protein n=1 Tax=Bagarius yarrelli TaxID=175774 RepID=A0A556U0V9_BAGYA|nr:FAS-associated death domain protein [Bagarius yarrelli]
MDRFKLMLLEISEKLSPDQLAHLKFLCGDIIGKKKSEEISSGVQLFEVLIERAEIGPGNTELLRKHLTGIGQHVLLETIDRYEGQAVSSELPDEAELDKINCAIELIVESLGRKWLRYGRKLGIAEFKLEGIQEKHPRNLEEQGRELFKEWKKARKAEANVDELIRALRECDLNYTADVVEKKLQNA